MANVYQEKFEHNFGDMATKLYVTNTVFGDDTSI